MKKTILSAICIAAALCSCTKQELSQKDNSKKTQYVYAHVNAATKAAFAEGEEGTGLSSVWKEGDFFYAIQDGFDVIRFTLVEGEGTTQGTFCGATTEDVNALTPWVAVLGDAAVPEGENKIKCEFYGQTGKLADIDDCYYCIAEGIGTEPEFDFNEGKPLSYIIRVKLPAGVKTVEYTPSSYFTVGEDGTAAESTYNSYSAPESSAFGADKTGVITLDSTSAEGDTVYISVPAVDFSATRYTRDNKQNGNWVTAVIITLLNGTEETATASTGTIVENNFSGKGGKIATLDMSSMTLLKRPVPADAILFTNPDASVAVSTNFKQAASVSTYWAPFNIGAETASETGNYYSFGEIIANKPVHSFPAYTLRHKPNGSNSYDDYMAIKTPSKLVDDDANTAFYTVAGSRYDVARVLWGTSWRLPHAVEGIALMNTVEKNGDLLKFTGDNGNSVYFAKTGYYKASSDSEDVFNEDTFVEFWTADKNNRSQGNAGWNQGIAFYANTDDLTGGAGRYDGYAGLTVRPVLVTSSFAAAAPSYINPEANAPTYGEDI